MDRSNLHLASYGSEQRSAFGCSGARVQGAGGGVNRGGPSPPLSRKIRLSIAGLALLVGSPLQLPGAGAATDAESAPPPDLLSVDAQRNYLRMLYSGVDDEVIWSIFGVKYGRVDNRLQALWKTATIGFSRIVYPQEGGYSLDVLEVVFYTDLESGERLETWFNPYSGREVPVNLPAPVTLSSFHSHVGPSERSAPGGIRVVESVEPPATLGYETWAQIEKHVTVTDEESGKVVFRFHGIRGLRRPRARPERVVASGTRNASSRNRVRLAALDGHGLAPRGTLHACAGRQVVLPGPGAG